jgi:hypothetical protein
MGAQWTQRLRTRLPHRLRNQLCVLTVTCLVIQYDFLVTTTRGESFKNC